MREIKFRAWDTVNEMWLKITGFETHNSDDDKTASINTGIAGMFHDGDYIGTFQKHGGEQNNVILLQYTGLKDINGREIYEDDEMKNAEGVTYKVMYEDGSFVLYNADYIVTTPIISKGKINRDGLEIIGNIYGNKELLD